MRKRVFLAAMAMAGMCAAAEGWKPLFDGKSLQGWSETPFKGHGKVSVENGAIVLGAGEPMTGITLTGSFPRSDYEVRFEASRIAGGDFFASLTFPVGESYATWVTGGWGGDIIGMSSIDGWDASDNETRSYYQFEPKRWYTFRLQVREDRVRAWIDEAAVFNVGIEGRYVGLRPGDIKLSAPFGFASYRTVGSIRKVEYRILQQKR